MIRSMEFDIDKNKAVHYLEYLEEKYTEWYTHPKKNDRDRIENEVRSMAQFWDDTIYIWLNDGRASGLFESGFFQPDLMRSMRMLKEVISNSHV